MRREVWLHHQGRAERLVKEETVIGRGATCEVVLDDTLVSRRHAMIRISEGSVTLMDLGSINGVVVNGEPLTESCVLGDGDRLTIGEQLLTLRIRDGAPPETQVSVEPRSTAETWAGLPSSRSSGDPLDLLGGLADKVLALGRGAEAERILASALQGRLSALRAGEAVAERSLDRAVSFAVRLAKVNSSGAWVDYVLEVGRRRALPLPSAIVDELYELVRTVSINRQELKQYLAVLREAEQGMGPAQRFLVQRLEGLERLVSAR